MSPKVALVVSDDTGMQTLLPETAEIAKARGAFYTPDALTRFLTRWAVRAADDRVLEPAAGDGAFVRALVERFAELGTDGVAGRILAIERDEGEAEKVRGVAPSADVRSIDFFDLDPSSVQPVSAIVGNPPYIRFHGFQGETRRRALARSQAQGVELSRLASSWAHFVVHAAGFLRPEGRLALVLPAELLHTDYGAPVRAFLLRRFPSVVVVAFDRAVFQSAQVDAVLLLASPDDSLGLRVIRATDENVLQSIRLRPANDLVASPTRWSASVDPDATAVYESAVAAGLGKPLGALAHVDIGFVSGANDFFILSRQEAEQRGLPDDVLTPVLRRPGDVPGILPRDDEVRLLLDLAGKKQLDEATLAYLAVGASLGVPARYKCRVRPRWYEVPLPKRRPDAFIPYMNHLGPRLIIDRGGLRNSNLLHGVAFKDGSPPPAAVAVAMASSLTLLSAEIEGRAYGGGVLKLETKEAERLVVPTITDATGLALALPAIDAQVRAGEIAGAARLADELLGIPHDALWASYLALRSRRLDRKRNVRQWPTSS